MVFVNLEKDYDKLSRKVNVVTFRKEKYEEINDIYKGVVTSVIMKGRDTSVFPILLGLQ